MTKEIALGGGMVTLVDDADYEWLSAFTWTAQRARKRFYAARSESFLLPDGRVGHRTRQMQQDLLYPGVLCPKGVKADHINRDPLDNRRDNLRLVSNSLSNINELRVCAARSRRRSPVGRTRGVGRRSSTPMEISTGRTMVGRRITGQEARSDGSDRELLPEASRLPRRRHHLGARFGALAAMGTAKPCGVPRRAATRPGSGGGRDGADHGPMACGRESLRMRMSRPC